MIQALRQRNTVIDQDKATHTIRRNRFLRSYLEDLRPFLSPQVIQRLEATSVSVGKPAKVDDEAILSTQPACISGGEMRDYQLLGLRWLITRHDAGIGAILGDEMVCTNMECAGTPPFLSSGSLIPCFHSPPLLYLTGIRQNLTNHCLLILFEVRKEAQWTLSSRLSSQCRIFMDGRMP